MASTSIDLTDVVSGNKSTITDNSLTLKDKILMFPKKAGTLAGEKDMAAQLDVLNNYIAGSASAISKPMITSPVEGTTNFYGTITSSDFKVSANYTGTHISTDWQIATDEAFTELVIDSAHDTINMLSIEFTPVSFSTQHYVRCRYRSVDFVSAWSDTLSFISKTTYAVAPTVIVVASDTENTSLTPSFTSSYFTVINGTDALAATDWQIASDSAFGNLVYDDVYDSTHLNALVLPVALDIDTQYYVRARYHGNTISSPWSDTVTFKTTSKTHAPMLSGDSEVYEDGTATIAIMNYSSDITYSIQVSSGNAALVSGSILWSFGKVTADTTATMTISALDVSLGAPVSDTVTYNILVKNYIVSGDQALSYDSTNLSTEMVKTSTIPYFAKMKPWNTIDLLDKRFTSTTTAIYLNNELVNAEIGDTFITETGAEFTVKTIDSTGSEVLERWLAVSVGQNHAAAIKSDGYLYTTGYNAYGQLGLGDATNRTSWTNTGYKAIAVACGYNNTYIIAPNGSVLVCGTNNSGQLGNGAELTVNSTTFINTNIRAKAIAAGATHVLALATDGTVIGWGDNSYKQLATGINGITFMYPTNLGIKAKAILAGGSVSGYIDDNDILFMGGLNTNGQLGLGTTVNTWFASTGIAVLMASTSGLHTVIIKSDGTVWTTGYNASGQLGLNSTTDTSVFTTTGVSAAYANANLNMSYLVMSDGSAMVSGSNIYGQLNNGAYGSGLMSKVFTSVATGVNKIFAGCNCTLFVMSANTIIGCGTNTYGQLGLGSTATVISTATGIGFVVSTPKTLSFASSHVVTPVTALTAAPNKVFIKKLRAMTRTITQDTGDNDFRSLTNVSFKETANNILDASFASTVSKVYYDNSLVDLNVGDKVVTINGELIKVGSVGTSGNAYNVNRITKISTCANNTAFMTDTGELWISGDNTYGQLGLGHTNSVIGWVNTGKKVSDFAMNNGAVYIINAATGMMSFIGSNSCGGFGLGNTTNLTSWYDTNITVSKIYCAMFQTFYLTADGSLYGAGHNDNGELGNGTMTSTTTFSLLSTSVTDMYVGMYHHIIKKSSGSFYGTGYNAYGQLGLGDTTNRYTWTLLPAFTSIGTISKVACGMFATQVLCSTNVLYSCGGNNCYEISTGSVDSSNLLTLTQKQTDVSDVFTTGGQGVLIRKTDNYWYYSGLIDGSYFTSVYANKDNKIGYTSFTKLNISNVEIINYSYSNIVYVDVNHNIWGMLGLYNAVYETFGHVSSMYPILLKSNRKYYETAWFVPETDLTSIPSAIYPISNVKFNNNEAVVTASSYSAGVLTNTCADIELSSTRTIDTVVSVPNTNAVTQLSATINKINA